MRDFELSRNGQANAVTSVMSVKDWAFIRVTLRRSAPRVGYRDKGRCATLRPLFFPSNQWLRPDCPRRNPARALCFSGGIYECVAGEIA